MNRRGLDYDGLIVDFDGGHAAILTRPASKACGMETWTTAPDVPHVQNVFGAVWIEWGVAERERPI
jgi:hypothetical protein